MVSNARMASLGEMAGNIAHEINNPLTIIKHSGKSIKKSLLKKNFSDERVEKFLPILHIANGGEIRIHQEKPFSELLLEVLDERD